MRSKWMKNGCLLMCMSLLLAGCGTEPAPAPEGSEPPEAQVSAAPELGYDDSLLESAISETGRFQDGQGQTWTYSYQVPQLLSEAPGARAINQALMDEQGVVVTECMEAMEQEDTPPF